MVLPHEAHEYYEVSLIFGMNIIVQFVYFVQRVA